MDFPHRFNRNVFHACHDGSVKVYEEVAFIRSINYLGCLNSKPPISKDNNLRMAQSVIGVLSIYLCASLQGKDYEPRKTWY